MAHTTRFAALKETAIKHWEAEQAFKEAARKYLNSVEPLPADEFWPMADQLAQLFEKMLADRRGSKTACDEFARRLHVDAADHKTLRPVVRYARFIRTFEETSSKLSDALFELPGLERSDDSYGDLCDSLVLAGKEIVERAISKRFEHYSELEEMVYEKWTDKDTRKIFHQVMRGENYFHMFLQEEFESRFPSVLMSLHE